jgi:hypothetical protein
VIKPIAVSTKVSAPPAEVYEFLDVLANHERFLDHFLVDWRFSGPARGLGARGRARTDAPGGQDWTDFEVIEVDDGRRIVEDGLGANGKRHTRGTYLLSEAPGGGTEVKFELEWLQASRAERLVPPLTRTFLRRSNRKAMRRLAKLLAG